MIGDALYKLIRKALPAPVYAGIAGSFLGRGRSYFRPATYLHIHDFYRENGLEFRGKRILEVGAGSQMFTALHFLSEGAAEVLIADPKANPASMREQLRLFNATYKQNLGNESLSRIRAFPGTSAIPVEFDGKMDIVCSHNVLEHIDDLEGFFVDIRRLISPDGESCHRVDVSDHTYHVFGKFPMLSGFPRKRALTHLQYSNRAFRLLNDPKCYMNRKLLPVYLGFMRKHGFRITSLIRSPCRAAPIHLDLFAPGDENTPENIHVTDFVLKFSK